MARVLVLTYDFLRKGEPDKGYSIATIAAYAKSHLTGLAIDYISFNMARPWFPYRLRNLYDHLNILRLRTYDAILIPDYVWCSNACARLVPRLRHAGYTGKIIVGGYQVTATPDDLIETYYPGVDHCIKGYAEEAIVQILAGRIGRKVVIVPVDVNRLVSPYLSGEISLGPQVRTARWETKRGCRSRCGFCEWSALPDRELHYIDRDRLIRELPLFRRNHITKIHVLDGTFNAGTTYLELMDDIGQMRETTFHFQTRPEPLATPAGEEFLAKCARYKNAYLELGIQTVVPAEMEAIGRKNDVAAIEKALRRLTELRIPYETNLIYGIPGQTLSSFSDSIDFLIRNGCPAKKIKAYALRIPRTSTIRREQYEIKEASGPSGGNVFLREWWYGIRLVTETSSFDRLEWQEMYRTAQSLKKGAPDNRKLALSILSAEARRFERYSSGLPKAFRLCFENGDPVSTPKMRMRVSRHRWVWFTPARFLCAWIFIMRNRHLIDLSECAPDGRLLIPQRFELPISDRKLECKPSIWQPAYRIAHARLKDGFLELILSLKST